MAFLPTTFDPVSVTNVSLSNGNLTATHSSTATSSGARSANTKNSGKYYFEIKAVVPNSADVFGLCTAANTYTQVLSTNATVIMCALGSGNLNVFSSFAGNVGSFIANDVACFAIDLTAGLVWIRKNAGNWNGSGTANPATAIGGVAFTAGTALAPVVAFGAGVGNEQCIANFGATAFANAAPADFETSWPSSIEAPVVVPASAFVSYVGSVSGGSRGRMIRRRKKGELDDIDVDELVKPYVASMRIGRQRYD